VIWAAQLIAMIGMSMVIPFLPLYVKSLGVTDPAEVRRWSGLVVSGVFITAFIATPFWGWLGDRVGKKKMVIRAIFGLAVSQFLIGLSQDVYQLFVFRMVQGALSGFIAASLALVTTNTPKEKSGYALGLLASSTAAGNVLGPFVGGLLADTFGYRNVFFITSAFCTISGILVIIFVKEIHRSAIIQNNVLDNYKFVFNSKKLRFAMMSLILSAAAISMIQPLFALFIEHKLSSGIYIATITGAIFAVMGLFQVISSPLWGKRNDRKGIKNNLIFALAGAGIGYAMHVAASGIWELIPIRAFLGFCIGGVLPSLYSLINKNTPVERKGGVMGIASSFTLFGNLLGPISSGYIASVTSIDFIFILSGILLIIGAGLTYKFLSARKTKIESQSEAKEIPFTKNGMEKEFVAENFLE
jgi:DHA1 family multidrug resistance protein-like MFS transporter